MIEYCFGIYYYVDKETGNIVYIGKDSHIDKNKRCKDHLNPSRYYAQPFNAVIQNNPDRYEYHVYCHVSSIEELNRIEFDLINLYRPKFNFKHGGTNGVQFTKKNIENFKYTVVKGGKGKDYNKTQQYCICDEYNHHLIQSIDYDYLLDIAFKLNTGELTKETIPKTKPFKYTVAKVGLNPNGKQSYCICDKKGNSLVKSIYYDKLLIVSEALNENVISPLEVKSTNGVNNVLGLLNL